MSIDVTIPIRTKRGLNDREHWAVRRARVEREKADVLLVLGGRHRREARKIANPIVTLTRISAGTLDGDNLQGALKAVRDAVAALLGRDDGPLSGIAWCYLQQRCKRGDFGVRIQIEEVDVDPRSA